MSTLQQQRLIVEQLRREASIKRINVSQAVEDIKKFVSAQERQDNLLFPPKDNPWKQKNGCIVL